MSRRATEGERLDEFRRYAHELAAQTGAVVVGEPRDAAEASRLVNGLLRLRREQKPGQMMEDKAAFYVTFTRTQQGCWNMTATALSGRVTIPAGAAFTENPLYDTRTQTYQWTKENTEMPKTTIDTAARIRSNIAHAIEGELLVNVAPVLEAELKRLRKAAKKADKRAAKIEAARKADRAEKARLRKAGLKALHELAASGHGDAKCVAAVNLIELSR